MYTQQTKPLTPKTPTQRSKTSKPIPCVIQSLIYMYLKIVLVMYMYLSNSVIKNIYRSYLHMKSGVVCYGAYLNCVEHCRQIGVVLKTAAVCTQKICWHAGPVALYIVQLPRL